MNFCLFCTECQTALSKAEQKIALLSADDGYQSQQPLEE
jgi:exonuclease VII small subunit